MPITITYLVHGTSLDNEAEKRSGWNDVALSSLGICQAKQLRAQLANKKFDTVFCSDLKRAVDTAQLAFSGLYPIKPDRRLREVNYGQLTAKHKSDFLHPDDYYVQRSFPQGESFQQVETRIADFIDYLKENYSEKQIAIVAHRAPQLALEVILNKKSWTEAISQDWRKNGQWQPGWKYTIKEK